MWPQTRRTVRLQFLGLRDSPSQFATVEFGFLQPVYQLHETPNANRKRDDREALIVQRLHDVVEAPVQLAHEATLRNLDMIVDDFVRALRACAADAVHR